MGATLAGLEARGLICIRAFTAGNLAGQAVCPSPAAVSSSC